MHNLATGRMKFISEKGVGEGLGGVGDIHIQSNLYVKDTQGNLKMWPL